MQELGTLYERGAAADEVLTKVVDIRRRNQGAHRPETLGAMNELATAINSEGDRARAGRILTEVLEGERQLLGGDHPETLAVMNNLAYAYTDQGQFAKAAEL